VDLEIAAVDAIVIGDDHLRQLDVLVLESLERAIELLDYQVQATQRPQLELSQLPLKVGAWTGLLSASSEVGLLQSEAWPAAGRGSSPALGALGLAPT
jgi:hypothetical protein